ncbi:hypothetical protein [Microbacterium sp. NPDC055521]
MTTRMTVAFSVLGLGLAVAALAGIPALIENRTVGDVVVVIGFAVAIIGLGLVFFAIPGQLKQNSALKKGEEFEIERLKVDRRRLKTLLGHAEARLGAASMTIRSATLAMHGGTDDMSKLRAEVAELKAALENNAIELRRREADPNAR